MKLRTNGIDSPKGKNENRKKEHLYEACQEDINQETILTKKKKKEQQRGRRQFS